MSTRHLLLLSLFSMLIACSVSPEPALPATTASTAIAVPTSTSPAVALATATPVSSPSFTPTPPPTRTAPRSPKLTSTPPNTPPTKTPTITPMSVPIVAAPAGLIYSYNKGQWQIAANGKPTLIISGTNLLLSPNGQMAIKSPDCCSCVCDGEYQLVDLRTGKSRNLPFDYREIEWSPDSRYIYYVSTRDRESLRDIWRWDVTTGEKRNLTHTLGRDEWWLSIWPQRSDTLVFYSTEGFVDGAGYIGHLTIMRTDGTGYQVVSKSPVSSPAAFSPDGRTIAYATYETIKHATYEESIVVPWYYRIGGQPQRFPWENFGLTEFKTMGFSSPSWSSDGQKVAWWMWSYDEHNKKQFGGVGVFNLESGTVALLDNFIQIVPDGWPDAVQWSPNSKRIAFFGGRQQSKKYGDWSEFGIWIAQIDGSHLRRLIDLKIDYNVCDWAWQPDGQWLAISCREHPEILSGIWLAELDTGKLLKTNLPDDAQIRGWVKPQP